MNVTIVGPDGTKLTPEQEQKIEKRIFDIIMRLSFHTPLETITFHGGESPLKGVDEIFKRVVLSQQLDYKPHEPKTHDWTGYKARNIELAEQDIVICISPKSERYCYHCDKDGHIKSGGCWTLKHAKKLGKDAELIIVE